MDISQEFAFPKVGFPQNFVDISNAKNLREFRSILAIGKDKKYQPRNFEISTSQC